MKTALIDIGGGLQAIVDEEDAEHVNRLKWYPRRTTTDVVYVQANTWRDDKPTTITLHRFIARALDTEHVDHRNSDGLDNRKSNLRVCTRFQNNRNARVRVDNTSGYKGVGWYASGNNWAAGIMIDKKRRHIGYFESKEAAARAYDLVAQKLWGEFAWLNFPDARLADEALDPAIDQLMAGRVGYLPQLFRPKRAS